MATTIQIPLQPSITPVCQLYAVSAGVIGATVGSPVTGSATASDAVYSMAFGTLGTGDYHGRIQSSSVTVGAFYMHVYSDGSYVLAEDWSALNALVNVSVASVSVLPGSSTADQSVNGTDLFVAINSLSLQSITCYESDGTTAQDLSGKTLKFCVSVEDDTVASGQTAVANIANSGITVSGTSNNVVTFRYTTAMVSQPRRLLWSLRDVSASYDVELQWGWLNVRVSADA